LLRRQLYRPQNFGEWYVEAFATVKLRAPSISIPYREIRIENTLADQNGDADAIERGAPCRG